MKTNGITATLVMKGNERQTGRKLEPEARSARECVHVKKHCFQKKKTKKTKPRYQYYGHGSTAFISAALASIVTAEMGDSQRSRTAPWGDAS